MKDFHPYKYITSITICGGSRMGIKVKGEKGKM